MRSLDAVLIAGDVPQEVLGREERESARLTVEGVPATLRFLQEYFRSGRNAREAVASLQRRDHPFFSLNGPYLRQYLEQRRFATALIQLVSREKDQLLSALAEKPRAVVISTTFLPFAQQIDRIAALVKQHAPDVTVIVGGVQVWKSYRYRSLLESGAITDDIREAVLRDSVLLDERRPSPVDVFVVSDRGEETLARLLECLRNGADHTRLDNVAYYEDGSWRINKVAPESYSEVKMDWRRFRGRMPDAYIPVQSGFGCRFRCKFCDFCGLQQVRTRTPQSIVEEIRTIPPVDGVRKVNFTDDNLFASRKRTRELCTAIAEADLSLRWRSFMRVTIADEEIAGLMADSGCIEVSLGVESGDADILRLMDKGSSPERILEGVRALGKHGISTKSCFIVGFPGETEESIHNTVDLLNAYPTDVPAVHRYAAFLFAVLPLSAAASPEFRAQHDLRGYGMDWSHDTMNSDEARSHMLAIPDQLKPELSPVYLFEMPELAGMTIEEVKRAYILRSAIRRTQRGLLPGQPGEALWDDLESLMRPSAPLTTRKGTLDHGTRHAHGSA